MGIKGFASFLRSTFPTAFTNLTKPRIFDEVYIDLNPFLHTCRRSASTPKQVLRQVRSHLLLALNRTRARRRIYIAIDGPAPLAKFAEQRERRADLGREHLRKGRFNGQHMTPGCLFMGEVERTLQSLGEQLVRSRHLAEFIIDGSCSQDEGEMKIMREIVKRHQKRSNPISRVILTGDSDAYLQALVANIPSLHLIDPFYDFAQGKSDGNCFSSEAFIRAFDTQNATSTRQMHLDFLLFALFCGNDCLPAANLGGLRPLWSFYLGLGEGRPAIFNQKNVDLEGLKAFMSAYLRDGLPPNLHGAIKRDSQTRPFDSSRLAQYFLALEWNLQRLILNEYSLELIRTPMFGPTVFDLAQMDVAAVRAAMQTCYEKVLIPIPGGKLRLPGANALMLLDHGDDDERMVAEGIASLITQNDEVLSDHESKELCEQILALSQDSFTPEERFVTFPRPAERFVSGKGIKSLPPIKLIRPCMKYLPGLVEFFVDAPNEQKVELFHHPLLSQMGKNSKGSAKKSQKQDTQRTSGQQSTLSSATTTTKNVNTDEAAAKALFERQLRLDRIAEYVEAEMALPLGTFDLASLQNSLVMAAAAAATNNNNSNNNVDSSNLEVIPPRLAALQRQLELLDQQHQYQQQQLYNYQLQSVDHPDHHHHHEKQQQQQQQQPPVSPPADALVASATATANQTEVSLRALRRRLAEVREQLYGSGDGSGDPSSFDIYSPNSHFHRSHHFISSRLQDEVDEEEGGGGFEEDEIIHHGVFVDGQVVDLDFDDTTTNIDPEALMNAAQMGLFQGMHTTTTTAEDPFGLESILELLSSPNVTVEAKIEGIRARFAAVLRQDLFWRSEALKANRMVQEMRMDKELVEMELDKANVLKGKLESLCRDLQAENRRILKERESPEVEKKPPPQTLTLPPPPSLPVPKLPALRSREELAREDKAGLIDRLEVHHKAYTTREELFEALQRTRELELAAAQARLLQQQSITAKAVTRADTNERRIGQLVRSEAELKGQVRQYVDKFRQVEETLGKSNDLFGTFRAEMEQMSAKLGKLERENAQLHNKCATLSRNIIEMADERTKQAQAYETLKGQKAKLEQLCRTLQSERNAALKRGGGGEEKTAANGSS